MFSPSWTSLQPLIPPDSLCVHAQLCPTLFDFMNCSPPGSSVHGIFQARILEWVATPGDLPNPGIEIVVPLYPWEAPPAPRGWYQVEPPVLYSSFPLAICFTYGNVYVSALLFQFVHKCVFYVCVSISAMFPSSLYFYCIFNTVNP